MLQRVLGIFQFFGGLPGRLRQVVHQQQEGQQVNPPAPDKIRFYRRALLVVVGIYTLVFANIDFIRFWGFGYHTADFGSFIQILWYAGNGEWPLNSTSFPYKADTSWLAFHFSPLIFILAPFFRLSGFAPEFLIIVHVVCMAFTALPLFATCMRLGVKPQEAFTWSLIYLLNPITLYATLFSIQDHTLAVPLFAIALWALVAKRFRVFVACLAGLLLAKEHFGVAVAGFGILWGWYHQEWRRGGVIAACGLVAVYVVIAHIMPFFRGGEAHPMFTDLQGLKDQNRFTRSISRYSWLHSPWPGPLVALFLFPFHTLNLIYYAKLFLPLFLMPLVGFMFLLPASADLAATIYSESSIPRNIIFYHASTMMPAMIIAACVGVMVLRRFLPKSLPVLQEIPIAIALFHVGIMLLVVAPLISANTKLFFQKDMQWSFDPEFRELQEFLETVPQEKGIGITRWVGPHIAKRERVYKIESLPLSELDIAVIKMSKPMFMLRPVPFPPVPLSSVYAMLEEYGWGIIYWDDPWLVLEKNRQSIVPKEVLYEKIVALYQQDLEDGVRRPALDSTQPLSKLLKEYGVK